jgi:hypothetical protein
MARTNECMVDRTRTTEPATMTTGALIFAFNNEKTDYVALAAWSAANIHRHLEIPVAVVTDNKHHPELAAFDQVIFAEPSAGGTRNFEDYQATVTWHNAGRPDAYNLTPWDNTLLLDADYIVASDQLRHTCTNGRDLQAYSRSTDVCNNQNLDQFGNPPMNMFWATVVQFRKCTRAQYVFDCMNMIKQNWQHYRDIYHIHSSTYRNDYSLSIAINIVNGHVPHTNNNSIAGVLVNVYPSDTLTQIHQDCYGVAWTGSNGKKHHVELTNQDLHAMGKRDLEVIVENHTRTRLSNNSLELSHR